MLRKGEEIRNCTHQEACTHKEEKGGGREKEPVQSHFDGRCEASRKHISRKFCTLG